MFGHVTPAASGLFLPESLARGYISGKCYDFLKTAGIRSEAVQIVISRRRIASSRRSVSQGAVQKTAREKIKKNALFSALRFTN